MRRAAARDDARAWSDPQNRRQDLRRRCMIRAKQHRTELLAAARGTDTQLRTLCHSIISAEMEESSPRGAAFRSPAGAAGSSDDHMHNVGHDEYVEMMAAMEEEIERELRAELHGGLAPCVEQELEDYEAYERAKFEESSGEPESAAVLCPLCMQGQLALTPTRCVACDRAGCALRLDAGAHPAPIEMLRERMCTLMDEHGRRCHATPGCRMPTPAERQHGALFFGCPACGMHAAVV